MYYPRHKVEIKYSHNDLKIKSTNKPYIGQYMETSNGRYFSGTNNMKPGLELIINETKLNKSKSFGAKFTVQSYNHRKRNQEKTMGAYKSVPVNKPYPTAGHYSKGIFFRYFAKRINGTNYLELDELIFNALKSKNGDYDHNLYQVGTIAWTITGNDVFSKNAKAIKNLSGRFPNLQYAFPILNEYAAITVDILENQYTAGGELYYADGTEYIGHYHIHPVKGPMEGATHTEEDHANLYYFHQLPDYGAPYHDWLANYMQIECFKCIAVMDTLQITSVQRSSLLGCVEGSYETESAAAANCPRIEEVINDIEEGVTLGPDRPNPPLEGGVDSYVWVNDAIGDFNDTIYSNFDTDEDVEDERNTVISGGTGTGIHPPTGTGGTSGGSSGYGGPSCFIPNTIITMADGTEKSISRIKIGDKVKSEKGESTVLNIRIHKGEHSVYSFNGGKPFVTAEHPFKTIDGWKAIDPITTFEKHQVKSKVLNINDIVLKLKGKEIIKNITMGETKYYKVYNLVLNNEHVYYANGYLVHNLKTVDVDTVFGEGERGFGIDDWIEFQIN